MSWKISHKIANILNKGSDNASIDREEALSLMRLERHTREIYALMETANRLSMEQFKGKGENHFHIGINVEACPFNCSFCSLTVKAGIFKEKIEFTHDEILRWAKLAESGGADALNLMTPGTMHEILLRETLTMNSSYSAGNSMRRFGISETRPGGEYCPRGLNGQIPVG
jgi:biotin synthase